MTDTPEPMAAPDAATVGLVWDTEPVTGSRPGPFLVDVFVGIKRHLSTLGKDLVVLAGARAADGVTAYVTAARRGGLDGLIVMGVDEGHPALTALTASDLACVAIDLPLYRNRTTYVASDNRAGAASAVAHLHALGHRDIATITGPLSLMPAVERLVGYRYEMARAGIPVRPEYIASGEFSEESGHACATRLLSLPEPPTAIFAADDRLAVGAMRALADADLSIPKDVAVVGFDDSPAADLVRPGLTTVAQDAQAVGVGAVSLLLQAIGAEPAEAGEPDFRRVAEPLLVPTRLVVRESCGASARLL
ncbi:MAG: substrate-binding domain-containing protein [Catenulispora sp.]